MKTWKLLTLVGLLAMLAAGCSKKKEEAAQLEQEMTRETAAGTTAQAESVAEDTAGYTTPGMDAGAIPREQKPEAPARQEEREGYVVQVAACESSDYAQYLVEKYTTRGYSPFVSTTTVGGQTYYRVRVGGFAALQEAKELQAELSDKYSVEAWIDKTK